MGNTCKNCEQQFKSRFKFCPYCGQQAKDELTIKLLFYNTINNYFSFDARFYKSFIPLLIKPGYLASKFVEGKRMLYLHPAKMYLLITIVFFFLFSFEQREMVDNLDNKLEKTLTKDNTTHILQNHLKDSTERTELRNSFYKNRFLLGLNEKQIDSILGTNNSHDDVVSFGFDQKAVLDSLIAIQASDHKIYTAMGMETDAGWLERRSYSQLLKFYKSRKGGSILKAFYDAIPIAMFFLLPIFAFILKLIFKKRGSYANHLVFSFYYFAFLFFVFSIILGVNFIWDIPNWIDWFIAFSTFLYLFLSLKRFYKQSLLKTIIKTSATASLFLLLVAPFAIFILVMVAFLVY